MPEGRGGLKVGGIVAILPINPCHTP